MFCSFCGKEVDDGVKFCPACGSAIEPAEAQTQPTQEATEEQQLNEESTPDVVTLDPRTEQPTATLHDSTDSTKESIILSDEQKKKKSKKPLIITFVIAAVVLIGVGTAAALTGFFGLIKKVEPGTVTDLYTACVKSIKQDNFTIDMTFTLDDESHDMVMSVDQENTAFIAVATDTATNGEKLTQTIAYSDGYSYDLTEGENSLPRGTVNEVDHDEIEEYKEDAIEILSYAAEGKVSERLEELIEDLAGESSIDSVLIAEFFISTLSDPEWASEYMGFTASVENGNQIYEMECTLKNVVKGYVYSFINESVSEELKDSIIDQILNGDNESYAEIKISLAFEVTDGLLNEITADVSYDSSTLSVSAVFSHYNDTDVDTKDIADKLEDAHDGRKTCKECDSESVYFKGMCMYCANDVYCEYYCGKKKAIDDYCNDCFIPCKGCDEEHGSKDGYCYDCYYERYCYEDCGKEITNQTDSYGYCDDCYDPCTDCDNQASKYYDGYCHDCFYEHFCYECGENKITNQTDSYGYCDECYDPCPDCNEQGTDYFEGYCYDHFYDHYCYSCGENKITHFMEYSDYGYCDDCFPYCENCGINEGNSYYDDLCSGCYYYGDEVCTKCYDARGYSYYGGYCYSCFY